MPPNMVVEVIMKHVRKAMERLQSGGSYRATDTHFNWIVATHITQQGEKCVIVIYKNDASHLASIYAAAICASYDAERDSWSKLIIKPRSS